MHLLHPKAPSFSIVQIVFYLLSATVHRIDLAKDCRVLYNVGVEWRGFFLVGDSGKQLIHPLALPFHEGSDRLKEGMAMNIGTIEIILIAILALVLFGGSMMVDVVGRMLIKNMKEIKIDGKTEDKDKDQRNNGDENA